MREVAFELECFEWADERLELAGRWKGLAGRRLSRARAHLDTGSGRRKRLVAMPGGHFGAAEESWRATFAWPGDPAEITGAELEVGGNVVVDLPLPDRRRRRRKRPAVDPGDEALRGRGRRAARRRSSGCARSSPGRERENMQLRAQLDEATTRLRGPAAEAGAPTVEIDRLDEPARAAERRARAARRRARPHARRVVGRGRAAARRARCRARRAGARPYRGRRAARGVLRGGRRGRGGARPAQRRARGAPGRAARRARGESLVSPPRKRMRARCRRRRARPPSSLSPRLRPQPLTARSYPPATRRRRSRRPPRSTRPDRCRPVRDRGGRRCSRSRHGSRAASPPMATPWQRRRVRYVEDDGLIQAPLRTAAAARARAGATVAGAPQRRWRCGDCGSSPWCSSPCC